MRLAETTNQAKSKKPLPRGKFRTNFQVVGAGSACNRPGPHQRTKRGFLGTLCTNKEYMARIRRCREKHSTQARHTITTVYPTPNPNPKKLTSLGENSGRIFRLSAPGAPTTGPDNTNEQVGISGHSLGQQRVSGAHQTMAREAQHSSATYHHDRLPNTKEQKGAFWVLFAPTKSTWRATKMLKLARKVSATYKLNFRNCARCRGSRERTPV